MAVTSRPRKVVPRRRKRPTPVVVPPPPPMPPGDITPPDITVPDAPAPAPERPVVPVSGLLQLSRAAHMDKKRAAGHKGAAPDYAKAEAAIRSAIAYREQAHAQDPQMTDAAWAEDRAANQGVQSLDLLAWFRHYLTIP